MTSSMSPESASWEPAGAYSAYPIAYDVEPAIENRNRLTTAFRLILYIPHAIIVGGLGISVSALFQGQDNEVSFGGGFGSYGLLGIAVWLVAILVWFAILFTGAYPRSFWGFTTMFLRWRARALTYAYLLRDEYPPFGDGDGSYRAAITIPEEMENRDRLSVGLRLIFVIPHAIVLAFVGIAAFVVTVIAWFAILFTGRYPEGMYTFMAGYLRWSLRVEGYVLLLTDEYPPFSLKP